MNRRLFLQRVGITTSAVFISPRSVCLGARGVGKVPSPSGRIAIGFIGTGRQAIHANIPAFLHQPDAQVVAVCDVDAWRMNHARALVQTFYSKSKPSGAWKGCSVHSDWRDLIARPDIDAVMISTPDHWHVPMALAALKAGKDVSCEKPLTRNIAQGRLLADTVLREKRVFCTDSEFRSYRMCRLAAELVRNEKIGKLKRVITGTPKDSTIGPQPEMPIPDGLDYQMWLGPAPEKPYTEKRVHAPRVTNGRPGWLCVRDYADGMIANWGAHLNDIAMWAMNTNHTGPIEVRATGTFPARENLWNVVQEFEATFLFENGVTLICKSDQPYIRFEGTKGWIHIKYPISIEIEPEELLTWTPSAGEVQLERMDSEKRNFLDAVKARKQPAYDAEAGHRNASLSHLALASIELGRSLKWDPVKEKAIGDDEANRKLAPAPMRAPWKVG